MGWKGGGFGKVKFNNRALWNFVKICRLQFLVQIHSNRSLLIITLLWEEKHSTLVSNNQVYWLKNLNQPILLQLFFNLMLCFFFFIFFQHSENLIRIKQIKIKEIRSLRLKSFNESSLTQYVINSVWRRHHHILCQHKQTAGIKHSDTIDECYSSKK